ncbi:putative zinc finger, CCHC-type containing protein [Tanacetum coccineum]
MIYDEFVLRVIDLKGNQIGYNAGNITGNVRNQFGQNRGQNQGVQNAMNQNGLIVVPTVGNQMGNIVAARAKNNGNVNNDQIMCYNCKGLGHFARNCTVKKKRDAIYLQTQLLITQKEEARIPIQAEEFDLMAAAAEYNEEEEINANCILMANLQQ